MARPSLEDVLLRYRANWMLFRGVRAVGSGMCETGKCLRVFVSDDFNSQSTPIPKKAEGYPVIIENAGSISAK